MSGRAKLTPLGDFVRRHTTYASPDWWRQLVRDVTFRNDQDGESGLSLLDEITAGLRELRPNWYRLINGAESEPAPPPETTTLRLWGSECTDCGNATYASQRCELCGRTSKTVPLYALVAQPGSVRDPLVELSIHQRAPSET